MSADPTQQLQQDRNAAAAQVAPTQAKIDAERQANWAAEEGELKPLEAQTAQAQTGLHDAISKEEAFKPTADTVKPPTQPIIDQKDFTTFSYLLLGLAMIGGAVSKGNWMGVSSTLNGAMKGYLEGNQQAAQERWKEYQDKFAAAQAHDAQMQKELEKVVFNRNLSVNQMLAEANRIGAKYDRQDVRIAAQYKSVDQLRKLVEDYDKALEQAKTAHDKMTTQITLKQMTAKLGQKGSQALDDYGRQALEQLSAGGDTTWMDRLQRRNGGEIAAQTLNDLGREFSSQGRDIRELTAAKVETAADKSNLTQVQNRLSGVERLTGSVQTLEDRVGALISKVNGNEAMPVAEILNRVKAAGGDQDLTELQTLMGSVGRQYVEAITMPGSNAQLHATTQDWADGKFSGNLNRVAWSGLRKAIDEEIAATHTALSKQVSEVRKRLGSEGTTIGGAPDKPGGAKAAPKRIKVDMDGNPI